MSTIVLFGLLILKHYVIATFLDVGYSKSRSRNVRWYLMWLSLHLLEEAVASWVILEVVGCPWINYAIGLEALTLALGCIAERKADYGQMLAAFLFSEFALLTYYILLSVVS